MRAAFVRAEAADCVFTAEVAEICGVLLWNLCIINVKFFSFYQGSYVSCGILSALCAFRGGGFLSEQNLLKGGYNAQARGIHKIQRRNNRG
jgi:hypothetical protein